MIILTFLFTEEKIRALKVGDEVLISGIVFTGREHAGVANGRISGLIPACQCSNKSKNK